MRYAVLGDSAKAPLPTGHVVSVITVCMALGMLSMQESCCWEGQRETCMGGGNEVPQQEPAKHLLWTHSQLHSCLSVRSESSKHRKHYCLVFVFIAEIYL